MPGRLFLLLTALFLLGEARGAESDAAPVWGVGGGPPGVLAANPLESPAAAGAGLSSRFVHGPDAPGAAAGQLHWKNVPRPAWLLLGGCLGLLGLSGFFRLRPRRESPLPPIVIVRGER